MSAEKQKTILLVEDEAIIAMSEKMALEKYGYRVETAHSGEQALAAVAATPAIDLILMDINLGAGMDGTEAAAEILKQRDIPVVFLSSHMEPDVVEKTEKITSYGYVVKDSSITVLDASIKMAFKLFAAKIREKEKEAALAHSHELMKYVIEHMGGAVAVHDRNLNYIYVSQRYLDEYKVKERDVIGRHHYDVFPDLPQKWRDVHQRALRGEISRNEDDPYVREDGTVEWTRWECRPWHEADGSIGGIVVYTEVTTERKHAELKLAQSLDLLTKLARLVPGVVYQYRLDPDGHSAFPYSSPGMSDIYEVTPEEVREDATPVFSRLHPEDYDTVAGAIQASALTLNTFYCEFRVILPRQGLRWRWSQAHPERLADGGTLWHGIIVDITERKLAEQALRASEERYRAVIDSAPVAILLTVPDGRILTANSAACRLFEMTEEEIRSRGRGDILDAADPRLAAALAERERTGRFSGELTFIRKNGDRFAGEVSSVVFKDMDGNSRTSMIIHDISRNNQSEQALRDRLGVQQAENELRRSEERFRCMAEQLEDVLYLTDAAGVITYISPSAARMFGWPAEAMIGRRFTEYLFEEEIPKAMSEFQAAIANGQPTRSLRLRMKRREGGSFFGELKGSILEAEPGARGTQGLIRDVSEREQAETALRASSAAFRGYFDNGTVGMCVTSLDKKWIEVNDRLCRMLGYSCQELSGMSWDDLTYPEDLDADLALFNDMLAGKRESYDLEKRFLRKDGQVIHTRLYATCQRRPDGVIQHFLASLVDISEQKQAEEKLREAKERYETFIAQTAEGVYRMEFDRPMPVELPPEEQIDYMYGHLHIAECNPAFMEMYGIKDPADILGKTLLDMHGGSDNPVNRETTRRFIAAGYRIQHAVTEEMDPGGNRKYFSNNTLGIIENGRMTRLWGTQADISDRVRMEAERHALQEIAQSVLSTSDLHEFLASVHRLVERIIPGENFFVALYDPQAELFEEAYSVDRFDAAFPPSRLEKSLSKYVFQTRRPLLATQENFAALQASGEVDLVGTPSPSWLGVPLLAGDKAIGVMVVQDYERENRYSQRDLELLVSIAGQVALVVERRRTLADLSASETRQAAALQMTKAGHWEYDVDADRFTFNDNFYRIFRTTAAAVGGYQMSAAEYARRFCHPGDATQVDEETRAAIAAVDPDYSRQVEHRILYADGEVGWIAVRFFIVKDPQGRTIKTYGVNQDISERKRAEEVVKQQLEEKSMLLKEVHHRIKNNFASIGGLLTLHMQSIRNPEAIAALKEAGSRIDSMRLLYEKLLLGGDFREASVKNYIESLAASVVALFPDQAKVKLSLDVGDFNLEPKHLFPLGIIINELLTNIMKYAFAGKKSGAIKLSLAKDGARVTLTLQDDGIGLPEGFDVVETKGFGLALVRMLCQQLRGSFSIEKHKGTRCAVIFDI